jgi:peptide chain release factor subunit 1
MSTRHSPDQIDELPIELLEVNQEALRALNQMGEGGGRVLSVYLSMDPPQVPSPRVRRVQLDSRLSEAEHQLKLEAADGPGVKELDACLQRVRDLLENTVVHDHGVRAVALFCVSSGELRAFGLRHPPDFTVAAAFRGRPAIEPLVEALPGPAWGVALVSRQHGRIFRGTDAALAELGDVDDAVHRRHAQGGWSQARFQRGIEKEVKDHVGHVCELLFAMHRRRPFDRLIVAGPSEIWPVVDAKLHPYLRQRLAGHVSINVEHSSAEQVLEHVRGLMEEDHARRESEALERLRAGLGTGDRAVAGLTEVFSALDNRRVATLLIKAGPFNEQLERAIEAAVAQSAEILAVQNEALEPFGEIAALLSY